MNIEEYEKQIYDLEQLLEISKSLNSTLDINILIESLLYTIMGQLKVVNVGIFLKDHFDDGAFRLHRNFKGFELNHGFEAKIESDSLIIRLMLEKPQCYTLGDIVQLFPQDPAIKILQNLLPSLMIPMIAKGGLIGFIIVSEGVDGEHFSPEQREYVMNIALFGAIAIHNSVLFEMASTDMMTKLKLRHYLLTMLERHYRESRRSGENFGIIMLDIDHFKKLNDTFGHSCGDLMLVEVANIIRHSVRKVDVTARYGGEEFIILLPNVSVKIATSVGERIRKLIAETSLEYEGESVFCTVSVGVAIFNSEIDSSPESVIKRADLALYRSKENGRDQLTISVEGGI